MTGLEVHVSGPFVESGEIPKDRGVAPDGGRQDSYRRSEIPPSGGRFWSSWNGSNAGVAQVVLGPFPAPEVLGINVCGYTHVPGNALYLEKILTHERLDLTEDNIGGDWCQVRLRLPTSWHGQSVAVHAIDGSRAYYGWLAVGEPRNVPVAFVWWNSFARKTLGIAGAGMVLFLFQTAALSILRRKIVVPPAVLPIASFALVCLAAYGVFWVFFASLLAGKILVWTLLAGSAWVFVCSGPDLSGPENSEHRVPLLLMVAIGCVYVGLLLLYGSDRTLSDIASRRFIDNLAVDNELPQMFADRLVHGEDPRRLAYGWWSSSERPPLQTSTDLLIAYPVASSGVTFDTATQSAGIWMQLIWVCSAWAWLRMLNVSARTSTLILAVIAPTGFLLLNTVYVWPKLFAGALMLGAFSQWLSMRSGEWNTALGFAALGTLLGLGFLAQQGSAFSLLALLPFLVTAEASRGLRSWAFAAAAFLLLALPWFAYQRYYNPPSDFLLKWHLGGVNIRDERGAWETIFSSYASRDLLTLLRYRLENFEAMIRGPWRDLLRFNGVDLVGQRNGQYFGALFALGPWNLGLAWLGVLSVHAWRGRRPDECRSRILISFGWCLATLAIWGALMFLPGSTVIHQGSYACILLLLLCSALALWEAHPYALILTATAALVDFGRIWILPNPTRTTPFHEGAAILAIVSCAAFLPIILSAKEGKQGAGQL